jgi:hypothetical protein
MTARNEGHHAMIMLCKPGPDWPTTVEEAAHRILARLTDAERDVIHTTPVADLDLLHFSLGAAIRNEFGLWHGNTALLAACESAGMHPDDASDVIVRAVWNRLIAGG